MEPNPSLLALPLISLSALAACMSADDAVPEWCVGEVGEPAIVFNSGALRQLTLREAWRRGGLQAGEELARPDPPAIDRFGRVVLSDWGLGEVLAIGVGGEWLGPVMFWGEGPEEVGLPVAVQWTEDGSLFFLDFERRQIFKRAFPSGEGLAAYPIPEGVMRWTFMAGEVHWGWISLLPSGDLLMTPRNRTGTELNAPMTAGLVLFDVGDPDAEPEDLLSLEVPPLSEGRTLIAPGFPKPIGAVGPSEVVAVAGDTEDYRIRILAADRSDSLVICRDASSIPLTRAELGDTLFPDRSVDPIERELDALRLMILDAKRPSRPVAMGRMFFGSTGRLWVQRDRDNPFHFGPPSGAIYDLFSPGGGYFGTVQAPEGVTFHGESDDWVIGYEVGDLGETSVVAYDVLPGGL
jgi:hypothetical protein